MKTIYCLFVALLFVLPACDENDQNEPQDKLVGFWKLTRLTGGITGNGYTPDFTDVEFKTNGTYRINNQDQAKGQGRYDLSTEADKRILRLNPSDTTNITFEFEKKEVTFERADKLILNDPCCDLFTYEFSRESSDD